MAKETAYLTPATVELFLRKLVTEKMATTSDEAGELLGGGHQTIVRLRKKGGTYAEALAMAAVFKKLKPFSAEAVNGAELAEIAGTPTGHALVKAPPKVRETAKQMRERLEAEIRAKVEAELRKKYNLPADTSMPETVPQFLKQRVDA
jgi:hypothetical protein